MTRTGEREASFTHPNGSETVILSSVWRCRRCGVRLAQPEHYRTDLALAGAPRAGKNGRER